MLENVFFKWNEKIDFCFFYFIFIPFHSLHTIHFSWNTRITTIENVKWDHVIMVESQEIRWKRIIIIIFTQYKIDKSIKIHKIENPLNRSEMWLESWKLSGKWKTTDNLVFYLKFQFLICNISPWNSMKMRLFSKLIKIHYFQCIWNLIVILLM